MAHTETRAHISIFTNIPDLDVAVHASADKRVLASHHFPVQSEYFIRVSAITLAEQDGPAIHEVPESQCLVLAGCGYQLGTPWMDSYVVHR